MNNLRTVKDYINLVNAFSSIGCEVYSDDFLCQVMAILLEHGNTEQFVINQALFTVCQIAQERFNLNGGEIPKARAVEKIQEYAKELQQGLPDWAVNISKRYNLNLKA